MRRMMMDFRLNQENDRIWRQKRQPICKRHDNTGFSHTCHENMQAISAFHAHSWRQSEMGSTKEIRQKGSMCGQPSVSPPSTKQWQSSLRGIWMATGISEVFRTLIATIITQHHAYPRRDLPLIEALLAEVAQVRNILLECGESSRNIPAV
jgi:hypothetical protein